MCWYCSIRKRSYDLIVSTFGIMLLLPFMVVIAIIIKISDGGTVFYRQTRVGRYEKNFKIFKFRTMVSDADSIGINLTKADDKRITKIGAWLRKMKLDELPQLWNVILGDMSLVGPRPEVPKYVQYYSDTQKDILKYKPGITDIASLEYKHEEKILAKFKDIEKYYIEKCIPEKIELNLCYANKAGFLEDTKLIILTIYLCFVIRY